MERVIAFATTAPQRLSRLEITRCVIVCGCALALIAAGNGFPL